MIATFPLYEILILFILEHYKHVRDAYFSFIAKFTSLNVLRICELDIFNAFLRCDFWNDFN